VKSKFVSNYLYNLVYQVLVLIVPLITTPYVSRVLGPQAIGEYGFTSGIVSYFGIVAASGTSGYAQREIAFKQKDKYEYSKIFYEILCFRLISTILVTFAYIIFVFFITKHYRDLYIIQFLSVLSWALDISWLFQGMEDFRVVTIRNSIVKILSTILIFSLVKSKGDLGIYTVILSGSILVGNLTAWPQLRKYLERVKVSELNIKRHISGIMMLFAAVVAVQLYTVLDQTMLGVLSNTVEVGYYVQAQKIIKLALTIISSMALILLPRIAVLNSEHDVDGMNHYFHISIDYLFILALPMMVGCSFCANNLVPVFFGKDFMPVIPLLQLLSVLFVVLGAGQLNGSLLTAINMQKWDTLAVSTGAVVNFTLNSFLIRKYASLGAVIASILAESTVTTIEIVILSKSFDVRYAVKSFLHYLKPTVIMLVALFAVSKISTSNFISLILELTTAVITYLICLIIMKDKLLFDVLKKFHIVKE